VHAIGVGVDDVQADGGQHRVLHRVLLIQEAGIGAGLHWVPGAPFVEGDADVLFRVVLGHDLVMGSQQGIIAEAALLNFKPGFLAHVASQGLVIMDIFVQGQRAHRGSPALDALAHKDILPIPVSSVGAAGDFIELVSGVIAGIGGVPAVQVRIVFGGHTAAAAPVLVAHAPEFELPRFRAAIFGAKFRHGGADGGHILDPFGELLHRTAAHIAGYIGLATDLTAQFKKLMGAKGVVFHNAAPMGIDHLRAVCFGTDAVHPVVLVCEAAAGPA